MDRKSKEDRSGGGVIASSMSLFTRAFLLVTAMLAMLGWCVMACRITSDRHPALDLASHLSWHTWMALTGIMLATIYALRVCVGETRIRWRHRVWMALPPWLYLTWVTAPWAVLPLAPNDSQAKGLRILSWNVLVLNESHEQALEMLRKSDADVIAILELSPEQSLVLKSLEELYPYCLWMPNESSDGIAVLSRIRGTRLTSFDLANEGMPAIEADIPATESHSGYRIMAVHTRSPNLYQRTLDRNNQLHSLAERAALPGKACIVVGDLNITPWSPPFQQLLKDGALEDSRRYRGSFASWPTGLGSLGIPIDHALVSKKSQVLYRGVGQSAQDSDHRPIILVVK